MTPRLAARATSDACPGARMLAAPCFVNEGSTTVLVPDVKGYRFGCPDVSEFSCGAQLASMQPGRNQRCVACVRRSSAGCAVSPRWDQSCG